ncbi:AAA family ATPase [Muricoccus vinaceus]|uniref:AAA family ATPase n=1 Tax=Muricoccus vinaceus TaxID=424704 RepID=A0ABV6IT57_9PROT
MPIDRRQLHDFKQDNGDPLAAEVTPDLPGDQGNDKGTEPDKRQAQSKVLASLARKRRGNGQRRVSRLPVPWDDNVSPDMDPFRRAASLTPSTVVGLLLVRAALTATPGFLARAMEPGSVSVIQTPNKELSYSIVEAWSLIVDAVMAPETSLQGDALTKASQRRLARARFQAEGDYYNTSEVKQVVALERAVRATDRSQVPRDGISMHKVVHALSHEPDALLPQDVILAEDQRLVLELPNAKVIGLVASALSSDDGWPSARLPQMPPRTAAAVSTLTSTLIDLARRPGQTPEAYLERLGELLAKRDAIAARREEPTGITLDDLPGLGAAGVWGRQTAADLRAFGQGELPWSELDRGVVLEGPPGTGKSSFARALANSARAEFVSASLAQWQGDKDGHLGSLCAAMRKSFEEARRKAPCVLLIDEVDSFPTRASVQHAYRDYVVQVVNALLEQLDGAIDRTGVLVVATCNDASRLDPALIRSGRLEQFIRLEKPNEEGLVEIARVHLAGALRDADLSPVTRAAYRRGAVGADIERWCRGARRLARTAGRPMLLEDLIAEVGEAPPTHGTDAVWRMAIHEAGHVLACSVMNASSILEVVVDPLVGGRSATTLDAFDLYRENPNPTRGQVQAQLRAALAGRAAEEVILGEPSGGAGGSPASDLAKATRIAVLQVCSSGLDEHPEGLLYLGGADDYQRLENLLSKPEVRHRVAVVLRDAYEGAIALVRRHRPGVEHVAAALVNRGSLSGGEVLDLLGNIEQREDA